MNHLPDEAALIAAEQGWNDESIIVHLLGYIQLDALGAAPEEAAWEARLAAYLRTCADDENLAATPCPDCNNYAVAPGETCPDCGHVQEDLTRPRSSEGSRP